MKTETSGYSIVDAAKFERPLPPACVGVDVGRAPFHVWVRGETDETETTADFLARARREAREAGFAAIEISGMINVEETAI